MGYIIAAVVGGVIGILVCSVVYTQRSKQKISKMIKQFRYELDHYEDIYSSIIDPSDKE